MTSKAFKSRSFQLAAIAVAAFVATPALAQTGDPAKTLADRFNQQPAKPQADAAAKRDAQRRADEREMLDRARREAAEQTTSDTPLTNQTGTVALPVVDLPAERKAELQRLAEKLKHAREAREARKQPASGETKAAEAAPVRLMDKTDFWKPEVAIAPAPVPAAPALDTSARSALGMAPAALPSSKVTVLLVMTPGTKGIRRLDHSADPILCTDGGCYVSAGAAAPARFMNLWRATGFSNTFGGRAGSCSHSLGCVFRDVDIGSGIGMLQPIDLKVMVHDRRQQQPALADHTCAVSGGRLTCGKPLASADYAMWVVPEAVAAIAGADELSRAVAAGLPSAGQRSAEGPANPLR